MLASLFHRSLKLAILVGTVMAFSTVAVYADGHALGYRKAVMKGIGGAMGGLKAVAKGQADVKHAVGLANAMNGFASITGDVFPKGSGGEKSRAKDEVWSKPTEFKAAVTAFQSAASNLANVAKGGDVKAIAAAFGQLGKSCGGCHKPFRKPKS